MCFESILTAIFRCSPFAFTGGNPPLKSSAVCRKSAHLLALTQSAVNKTVFLQVIATQASLHTMALTETWIFPDNTYPNQSGFKSHHSTVTSLRSTRVAGHQCSSCLTCLLPSDPPFHSLFSIMKSVLSWFNFCLF